MIQKPPSSSSLGRFLIFSFILLLIVGVWSARSGLLLASDSGDDRTEHMPDRAFNGQAYRTGQIPLWNPYLYSGIDQPSVVQPGVFYPPNAIFYAIFPAGIAFNLLLVAHLLIAFYFMREFLLAHELSSHAAFFGGLAYALTGFSFTHIGVLPLANACVWVPAVFYFFEKFRQTGRVVFCLSTGACVALQLLAGWPQMVVLTGIYLALYLLVALPKSPHKRWLIVGFIVLFVFSAAVGLVQILPTLELKKHSNLSELTYPYFGSDSVPLQMFAQLLFPFFYGMGRHWPSIIAYWGPVNFETTQCYLGILPLLFAAAGLRWWRSSLLVRFAAFAIPLSLLLAAGTHSFLGPMLYHLPVYNFFRDHMVNLLYTGFSVAALAAVGFSAVETRELNPELRRSLAYGVPLLFVAVASMLLIKSEILVEGLEPIFAAHSAAWKSSFERTVAFSNPSLVVAITVLLFCCLAFSWKVNHSRNEALSWVVIFVLGLDLGFYGYTVFWGPSPANPTQNDKSVLSLLSASPTDRTYSVTGDNPFLHINLNQLAPPHADIMGYGSFLPYPYADLVELNTGGNSPVWAELVLNHRILSLLNVRYVIVNSEQMQQLQTMMPISENAPVPPVLPTAGPELVADGKWEVMGKSVSLGKVMTFSSLSSDLGGVEERGIPVQKNSLYQVTFNYRADHEKASHFGISFGAPDDTRYQFITALVVPAHTARFSYIQPTRNQDGIAELKFFTDAEAPLHVSDVSLRRIAELPLSGSYYQIVERKEGVYVLQNQDILPRAYIAGQVEPVANYADARAALWNMTNALDLRQTALVENWPPERGTKLSTGEVLDLRSQNSRVNMRTRCAGQCFLVLTDRYDDGWRATVDGQPTKIYPTDGVVRGVLVPAGEHQVAFLYRPKGYLASLWVSGFAFFILALSAIAPIIQKRTARYSTHALQN